MLSKPSVSACCAMARIAAYGRLRLFARSFARKTISPIFTAYPQLSSEYDTPRLEGSVPHRLWFSLHRIWKGRFSGVLVHLLHCTRKRGQNRSALIVFSRRQLAQNPSPSDVVLQQRMGSHRGVTVERWEHCYSMLTRQLPRSSYDGSSR